MINLFDDDDFMTTTPKENFFQIIKVANQNIVELEIEKLVERLAVAEKILEENSLDEKYERLVKTLVATDPAELENRKNSIFIETVGEIVSKAE
jgi:hypothetical protein